ncbi:MAG TPA: fructosamine kinase family protein [Tepidisphaeraceae bacterium]
MAPHEVEVSWQSLRQIVREWAGSAAELEEVTPLAGGCINTTLCLQTRDGSKAVLKITPHRVDRAYGDEVHQLQLLRDVGIPVPDVYLCRTGTLENPFSYLLMEFIEGVDLAGAKAACSAEQFDDLQAQLAELVMRMHDHMATHYMRVTAAEPKRYERWPECYRDVFDGIWAEVAKSGQLPVKVRKQISRIHDRLDRLLAHDDCPRLVHWDLWSTNILARPGRDGRWRLAALLDPLCKYAHAEAEIAYLELFHTIAPAFLRAYQQRFKLPGEYARVRRPVYQMYSLINHLRLFGPEYLPPLLAAVERTRDLA